MASSSLGGRRTSMTARKDPFRKRGYTRRTSKGIDLKRSPIQRALSTGGR